MLLLLRRVALEEDMNLQLPLDVAAPGEHPRAERDEQAEQAHPDEHGHRRRERRREVHPDRGPRLGEQQAGATHSEV
jgi:hypothetical protein